MTEEKDPFQPLYSKNIMPKSWSSSSSRVPEGNRAKGDETRKLIAVVKRVKKGKKK